MNLKYLLGSLLFILATTANAFSSLEVADYNNFDDITAFQAQHLLSPELAVNKAMKISQGQLISVELTIETGAPAYLVLFNEQANIREIRLNAESGNTYSNQLISKEKPQDIVKVNLYQAIANAENNLQAHAIFAMFNADSQIPYIEVMFVADNHTITARLSDKTGQILMTSTREERPDVNRYIPSKHTLIEVLANIEKRVNGQVTFIGYIENEQTPNLNNIFVDIENTQGITSFIVDGSNGQFIKQENEPFDIEPSAQAIAMTFDKVYDVVKGITNAQFVSADLYSKHEQLIYGFVLTQQNETLFIEIDAITGAILPSEPLTMGDNYEQ